MRPLILSGAGLAMAGAAAAAPPRRCPSSTPHLITGGGVACLLSAGFAGVAAYFPPDRAAWAMGYVVGAQSIAWIAGGTR